MLFNSLQFLEFFAVVFPLYCVLNRRGQNLLLLISSYYFYACWDYRFLALMVFTTAVDFEIGQKLESAASLAARKRWLIASLALNLGVLGFFKYCNFFIGNAQTLLHWMGFHTSPWELAIVLPVGISFYTFHEMSYIIDVYRGERKAARDFATFACFIAFFPQLVAGPIGRASLQLPQFEVSRQMSWDGWARGAMLFLLGLVKKICIADVLGPIADKVFSAPEHCTPGTLLVGIYCFSFQIYADFSGYSDMARGLATLMGFNLIENFNQPYLAENITDFWRRWHISLSNWLRDYLYIPLGGNRHGEAMTYRNLFLTMFIGGLWHGASWTFAAWGTLHGLYLAVHKALGRKSRAEEAATRSPARFLLSLLNVVGTFHLVAFAWIFFRAKDFSSAWHFIAGFFRSGKAIPALERINAVGTSAGPAIVGIVVLLLMIDLPQRIARDHCIMLRWTFPRRVLALSFLTVLLIATRETSNAPFIYFQF